MNNYSIAPKYQNQKSTHCTQTRWYTLNNFNMEHSLLSRLRSTKLYKLWRIAEWYGEFSPAKSGRLSCPPTVSILWRTCATSPLQARRLRNRFFARWWSPAWISTAHTSPAQRRNPFKLLYSVLYNAFARRRAGDPTIARLKARAYLLALLPKRTLCGPGVDITGDTGDTSVDVYSKQRKVSD